MRDQGNNNDGTGNTDTGATGDSSADTLGDAGRRALEAERKARRNAEQTASTLGQRVEALQRTEIQRIAGAGADGFRPLADATDLWRADEVELSSLLNDAGDVDADRVRETVGRVIKQRPHWGAAPARALGSADGGRGAPSAPSMDDIAAKLIGGQ